MRHNRTIDAWVTELETRLERKRWLLLHLAGILKSQPIGSQRHHMTHRDYVEVLKYWEATRCTYARALFYQFASPLLLQTLRQLRRQAAHETHKA